MIEKRFFKDSYETTDHLTIEKEVVGRIEKGTNIRAKKLPKRDVLDFALTTEGDVIGFLEVRSRNCDWSVIENGGFYLPLKKIERIKSIHRATGLSTCLVVRCTCSAFKLWLGKHDKFEVIWWGDERSDKDFDREPMIRIPAFFFKHFYII
jgi:hypothetical protein